MGNTTIKAKSKKKVETTRREIPPKKRKARKRWKSQDEKYHHKGEKPGKGGKAKTRNTTIKVKSKKKVEKPRREIPL